MRKFFGLIAAIVLSMFASTVSAADRSTVNKLAAKLALEAIPLEKSPEKLAVAPLKLSLVSNGPLLVVSDFVVGRDTVLFSGEYLDRRMSGPPGFAFRDEWQFIRRQTAGPDALERLGDLLDVEERERPWSTTTVVHLLAPGDFIRPFAAMAHEESVNADLQRVGIGAGAMVMLGKKANIGVEAIYFGGDKTGTSAGFGRETRFLAGCSWNFESQHMQ